MSRDGTAGQCPTCQAKKPSGESTGFQARKSQPYAECRAASSFFVRDVGEKIVAETFQIGGMSEGLLREWHDKWGWFAFTSAAGILLDVSERVPLLRQGPEISVMDGQLKKKNAPGSK